MSEKIIAQFIIQIAGKPKENVDKALKLVLDKIKENKKHKVLDFEIVESQKDDKNPLYSGFIDLEIKFNEAKDILEFIADYTPNSVEIIEPTKITLDNASFSGILNDMANYILKSSHEVQELRAYIHYLQNKKK